MPQDQNQLQYRFDPADNLVFLREVLTKHLLLSHSLQTKLKAQSRIKVNGQVTLTNYKLRPGDLVTVDIDLDESNGIAPIFYPLDIVFEDHDCLVLNKPAGIAVHSQRGGPEITLANAVSYYWNQQGRTSTFRPVNRLDKTTSGLILIAQSNFAHQAIYRQQLAGLVHRSYFALVDGLVPDDSGVIDQPIAQPDPEFRSRAVDPSGKPALTYFNVIRRYACHTLVSLTLGTGRTHQIRVHLNHLGHPICGDTLYGKISDLIDRPALHAAELAFLHPRSAKPITFQVPWPQDMIQLVESISKL